MRKILLNSKQMGLLSKAYLENLFPRPHLGDLKNGLSLIYINGKECMNFYLTNFYHDKLSACIYNEYVSGKFSVSNAETEWVSLMDSINKYEVIEIVSEETNNYWLSITEKVEDSINEISLNLNTYEEIEDNDGNIYKTIKIGNQTWLAENFKSTKYNDGSQINCIEKNDDWENDEVGAYCWLENNVDNKRIGALYNWNVFKKNICPNGWRLPTDDDWDELKKYLNSTGFNYDGSKDVFFGNKIAKSLASTNGWRESSKEGSIGYREEKNNTSKFNALPGGFRFGNGKFTNTPESAILWWSMTEYNGLTKTENGYYAKAPSLGYDDCSMGFNIYAKSYGCYVRLIKENLAE